MKNRKLERTAPFITSNESVRTLMCDALMALLPALAWALYSFGMRVLTVVAVSVGGALVSDLIMSLIVRRRLGVTDLSFAVTGLIYAFTLPYEVHLHIVAAGSAFAIIVAKGFFGGLGKNIFNPAVCGRVLVEFIFNSGIFYANELNTKALTDGFKVLNTLNAGEIPSMHLVDMFMGDMSGAMGEISTLLLLAGGVYLILRGTVDWRIPTAFVAAAAATAYLMCPHYDKFSWVLGQLFTGALALAALFLATDPTTSPITPSGKLLYGAVGGALCIIFRMYLPIWDGVFVAILAANALARPIDLLFLPRAKRVKNN